MALDEPPAAEPKLQLDPNPSPAGESEEFKNPDEAQASLARAHELALLDKQQGHIGRLIGSSQPSLTIAFIVIGIAGIAFLLCLIGMMIQPSVFGEMAKTDVTVILTVAGYVFGVKSSEK